MTGFQHDKTDNPYAPLVLLEEDEGEDSNYDLLKIATLYNRLGGVLKWFIHVFCFLTLLVSISVLLGKKPLDDPTIATIVSWGMVCLIISASLVFFLLYYVCAFTVDGIAYAMNYRNLIWSLIFYGATIVPVNIIVMILMRRKAKQILSEAGVEIIGGRVDLTQIPVEEDY